MARPRICSAQSASPALGPARRRRSPPDRRARPRSAVPAGSALPRRRPRGGVRRWWRCRRDRTGPAHALPAWQTYRHCFLEHYGPHALVPLLACTDPVTGIGLPDGFHASTSAAWAPWVESDAKG
ncbi:lantibiotic dehydratase [Streptomyces sp. NPDC056411]|uniref:lantibiotic dehydratase n=1 Tax=Streptomyces sp. NPDC056411 TaxID=3345813 RepID=UPI0035DEFA4B